MIVKPEPLTNKEAVAFWGDKVHLSPGDFAALSDEARLKAFVVSGIAKGDELTTAYNALQRALDDGITYEQFKEEAAEVFEKRGWTGKKAWRVDNIFRTNIQQAYSIGRYKQMKEVASLRPYWMYDAVNDSRTRPTHAALDKKVFPADHPFWDTWYPLNGFRCRCGVITLSERQVKKRGLKVETKDPTGGLIEPVLPDGTKLPARPLIPDPGFSYHPGKAVYGGITPREDASGGFTDIGIRTHVDYKRRKMDNLQVKAYRKMAEGDLLPQGKNSEFYVNAFLEEFGFSYPGEGVFKDSLNEPLIISEALFKGRTGKWKIKKRGREKYLKLMAQAIKDPYEVWLVPMREKKTGRVVLRKRFIRGFSSGPDNKLAGVVVFDYGKEGWEGVTAFKPDSLKYLDKKRNGVLLYGE